MSLLLRPQLRTLTKSERFWVYIRFSLGRVLDRVLLTLTVPFPLWRLCVTVVHYSSLM